MSDMKATLKGVVRDHRLPRDYKFHFAQPASSKAWIDGFNRYIVVRQMTKNNVTIPLLTLLVSANNKEKVFIPLLILRGLPGLLANKTWYVNHLDYCFIGLHTLLYGLPRCSQLLLEWKISPGFPTLEMAVPL